MTLPETARLFGIPTGHVKICIDEQILDFGPPWLCVVLRNSSGSHPAIVIHLVNHRQDAYHLQALDKYTNMCMGHGQPGAPGRGLCKTVKPCFKKPPEDDMTKLERKDSILHFERQTLPNRSHSRTMANALHCSQPKEGKRCARPRLTVLCSCKAWPWSHLISGKACSTSDCWGEVRENARAASLSHTLARRGCGSTSSQGRCASALIGGGSARNCERRRRRRERRSGVRMHPVSTPIRLVRPCPPWRTRKTLPVYLSSQCDHFHSFLFVDLSASPEALLANEMWPLAAK